MDGYLHQTARPMRQKSELLSSRQRGETVSDDEFWQFLKVIHVLSFDLNTPTAQTEAWVKTLLAHTTNEQER